MTTKMRVTDSRSERISRWISSHIVQIQAIFGVIGIIGSGYLGYARMTNELIISLLILLCCEFLIMNLGYLESIKKSNEKILAVTSSFSNPQISFVGRYEPDLKGMIESAENDVFISGSTLAILHKYESIFKNLESKIDLRLLTLDIRKDIIIDQFCKMHDSSLKPEKLTGLNMAFLAVQQALRGKAKIAYSDRIMPYAFVAIDILRITPNSCIRIQHYLHEKADNDRVLAYVVKPGCEVFDTLKDQIEILWSKGTPRTK